MACFLRSYHKYDTRACTTLSCRIVWRRYVILWTGKSRCDATQDDAMQDNARIDSSSISASFVLRPTNRISAKHVRVLWANIELESLRYQSLCLQKAYVCFFTYGKLVMASWLRQVGYGKLVTANWLQKLWRFQSIVKHLEEQRSGKTSISTLSTHFFLSLSACFHQSAQFRFSQCSFLDNNQNLIDESVRAMTMYIIWIGQSHILRHIASMILWTYTTNDVITQMSERLASYCELACNGV